MSRRAQILGFLLVLLGLSAARSGPALAGAPSLLLASDASWDAFSGDPTIPGAVFLGKAQPVCLNATTPAGCPAGAVLYGDPATIAWTADLSTIPGAVWVWAPGVTGATTPADLAQVFLTKTITLPAIPLSASISVAADDFAEVVVNGVPVGATGSVTDPALAAAASSTLTTFDITSRLLVGDNRIVIQGINGPASFACGLGPCSYQQNPAGVVFGGLISSDRPPLCDQAFAVPGNAWPPNHKPVTVTVADVTDPDGDPVAITIDAIRQDEPVDDGSCSGAGGIGTDHATVPVERSGQGDGRVYHFFFRAEDPSGGACTGDVTLCVPHDQGHGGGCGDGGPLFDSVGFCGVPPPVPCAACDDGDPCTVDVCTPTGCAHSPVSCDDGVACTVDTCLAGICQHVPATGFDDCRCKFDELPPPEADCFDRLPGNLRALLEGTAQLVARAPGRDDPHAARPMVRRALRHLARASRLLQRARSKDIATACLEDVRSRIRSARLAARGWLSAR